MEKNNCQKREKQEQRKKNEQPEKKLYGLKGCEKRRGIGPAAGWFYA